ncbi:MAG: PaaX family transcriptional regulator C-terminal domain-containing protein [Acidimicrobiia bacterium]
MQQPRNTSVLEPVGLLARPLSARSVIASLLLGMHPPRMRGALLVRWCDLFGIAEGTTRVALSRMRAAGELELSDGAYALAGPLLARQRHQEWSLAPQLRDWTGEWKLAVVAAERRRAGDRQALRTAMRRLRYAERREGLWVRPDNLPHEAAPVEVHAIAEAQCSWWTGTPDTRNADEMSTSLFALDEWAARSNALEERLAAETASLLAEDFTALADAFVVGAAALQQVRADPLLPHALLPSAWPGARLRDAYRDYREAFGSAATVWFRAARRGHIEIVGIDWPVQQGGAGGILGCPGA